MADPASIAAGGNTVSHAGLFTAFGGWLLSSEAAVLIGIVMSIGGFLVNVYFKWRQQQRQIAAAAEQSRQDAEDHRSEEHTSELQSLMRISYAVFCLQKKHNQQSHTLISQ